MQRVTDGRPANSERRASVWQYWQSILYVCTWTLWGNAIGCTDGSATAGRRLHDESPRKTSTARSTAPSTPTPAFAVTSRDPSGTCWYRFEARECYHLPSKQVNTGAPGAHLVSALGRSRERRGAQLGSASAAAFTVASTSASVCASETKAASNCDGAK